ncbi:metal-dependent hydrolase [Pokkaliibacter sp. CJK22405]|uniref:metal-dependent hydrolase n=1 Tax=Pokkaliibacter sp. CJK22405 TaxID=3384615 RepID=UPI003984B310
MADFKTHVAVAAGGTGLLASVAMSVGVVSSTQASVLWLAGIMGGLLPDIDSDSSRSVHWIFSLIATLVALAFLADGMGHLPILMNWLLAIAIWVMIRFPLLEIFKSFTVHRGLLHSLLANGFFTLVVVVLADRYFGYSAAMSWACGAFVLIGAMIHLLLDELYSVDLEGARIKRSFGTAIKITDWDQPMLSGLMLGFTVALFWFSPAFKPFAHLVSKGVQRCQVSCHLMPPSGFDVANILPALEQWFHSLIRIVGL